MSELLRAAKAVIEATDAGYRWCAIANLRAAVERAERQEPVRLSDGEIRRIAESFRENPDREKFIGFARAIEQEAWTAAQQAERGRIKDIVAELLDPEDPWIHYSTLLEKIDATTE